MTTPLTTPSIPSILTQDSLIHSRHIAHNLRQLLQQIEVTINGTGSGAKQQMELLIELGGDNGALGRLREGNPKFCELMEEILARDLFKDRMAEGEAWLTKVGFSIQDFNLGNIIERGLGMSVWSQTDKGKDATARIADYARSKGMDPQKMVSSWMNSVVMHPNISISIERLLFLTECLEAAGCTWTVPQEKKADEKWITHIHKDYAWRILEGKNKVDDETKLQSIGIEIDEKKVFEHLCLAMRQEKDAGPNGNAVRYAGIFFAYAKANNSEIPEWLFQDIFESQAALSSEGKMELLRATEEEANERSEDIDYVHALGAAAIHFVSQVHFISGSGGRFQKREFTRLLVAFERKVENKPLDFRQQHALVEKVQKEIGAHPANLGILAGFYDYILEQLTVFDVDYALPTSADLVRRCITDRLVFGKLKLKEAEAIRQEAKKAGIKIGPTNVDHSGLITAGFLGLLKGDGGDLEEFSSLMMLVRHSWSEGERYATNMPIYLQDALGEYTKYVAQPSIAVHPSKLLATLKKLMRVSSELKLMGYARLNLEPFTQLVGERLLKSQDADPNKLSEFFNVRILLKAEAQQSQSAQGPESDAEAGSEARRKAYPEVDPEAIPAL